MCYKSQARNGRGSLEGFREPRPCWPASAATSHDAPSESWAAGLFLDPARGTRRSVLAFAWSGALEWEVSMSGKSRQETPETSHSGPSGHALPLDGDESLLAMVERTLEYLENDPAADPDGNSTYSRAFPVGESIGRQFWKRCSQSGGPYGLAMLIENMVGLPPVHARTRIQRALFSGFCWQLEQLLRQAAEPDAVVLAPVRADATEDDPPGGPEGRRPENDPRAPRNGT